MFANHRLIFDGNACIYWPTKEMVIVADLHLEKGSYLAEKGNPIPLYDTIDTLSRLEKIVDYYQPKTLVSLGDNIHDIDALNRIYPQHKLLLEKIANEVRQWVWVMGNHDKNVKPLNWASSMIFSASVNIDNILLTHDLVHESAFQIVGHYHPKTTVKNISGKCFLHNDSKIIMPSFGSYTGGFEIESTAFKKALNHELFNAFLLHNQKIWRVK